MGRIRILNFSSLTALCWNLRNTARLFMLHHMFLQPGGPCCPKVAVLAVELDPLVEVAHMILEVVGAGGLVLTAITRVPHALTVSFLLCTA